MNSNPTTLREIISALTQLGGEATAKDIKDQVTSNRGGIPPQYGRSHSYRETIQKIIEDHCPESKNFRDKESHFKRVSRGRYKLINKSTGTNSFTTHSDQINNIKEPQKAITKELSEFIQPTADTEELEKRVAKLLELPYFDAPEGIEKPKVTRQNNVQSIERDPTVKAWTIRNAKGYCEYCKDTAFVKVNGNGYLEVHHLRQLAKGGSDTIQLLSVPIVTANYISQKIGKKCVNI